MKITCGRLCFCMGTIALFALQAATALAIEIDTVPVGNISNPNDPSTGNVYGGVGYHYSIGRTEVTVGQYSAFLNAVGATDTYSLYNVSMATDANVAGIARTGASGSYSYSVIGSPNKPVTYVSWGDAARFSNWLHNGQPTGAQNVTTTEGRAYTLNGATSDAALNAVGRNGNAQWAIPRENEWYKAAYYQPASEGGDADGYWSRPTGTNNTPYSDQPPGTDSPTQSNTANFYRTDALANGFNDGYAVTGSTSLSVSQNYLTDVGAYTASASPYGTYDQGGNVFEWNEGLYNFGTTRAFRGGSWSFEFANVLQADDLLTGSPSYESNLLGFRVTTVPEPSTGLLAIVACGLLWARRKRIR